jgi:hypothetical protein
MNAQANFGVSLAYLQMSDPNITQKRIINNNNNNKNEQKTFHTGIFFDVAVG